MSRIDGDRCAAIIQPRTERLFLRQWREGDRQKFAEMSADPQVMEFFPNRLSRSESDAMVDQCEALIAKRGWGFWALELIESKSFLGFVGLNIPNAELPCSPCVEVGWRLARNFWGRGFATEGARMAVRVGFEQLGLQEIVSFTAVRNYRSRAVMERLGMQNTMTTFQHPGVSGNSALSDHCLYSITRPHWREQTI